MDRKQILYKVNEVCKMFNTTRKTLYYYDKIGLLQPVSRKGPHLHKLYTQEEMKKLEMILDFRDAGVPIYSIKAILDNPEDINKIISLLEETKQSLIIHYREVDKELKKLEVLINRYKEMRNN